MVFLNGTYASLPDGLIKTLSACLRECTTFSKVTFTGRVNETIIAFIIVEPDVSGLWREQYPFKYASSGCKTSVGTSTLEAGAQLIQSRPPIDAMSAYLDGFHFYSGDKNGQMEAHHYVTVLNEDVMQAVIYDGNTKDARLMGVEYIISERLFNTLPPEEKNCGTAINMK